MSNTLYLGDAFGWDTEYTAKVAILELKSKQLISVNRCVKAQLLVNQPIRWKANAVKILGYIPIVNVILGAAVIIYPPDNNKGCRPHNKQAWIQRGIAMIVTGPLLAIVDLVKYIFDCKIVKQYLADHVNVMQQFNTLHKHTPVRPGSPIHCVFLV
jgi:hypothetical protein